jgi:hypothetical protein
VTPTLGAASSYRTETCSKPIKARWYLIQVSNARRYLRPANDVRLVITRVQSEGAGSQLIDLFTGRVPLQWERQELAGTAAVTVGPDAYASLFYVQDDGLLKFTTLAELVHFPKAKKGPQTYWVTLRGTSIEDDSPPSIYKIVWDGKWEDGDSEMRNHVSVEKA